MLLVVIAELLMTARNAGCCMYSVPRQITAPQPTNVFTSHCTYSEAPLQSDHSAQFLVAFSLHQECLEMPNIKKYRMANQCTTAAKLSRPLARWASDSVVQYLSIPVSHFCLKFFLLT